MTTFNDLWKTYIADPGRADLRFNVQAETAALDAWEAAQAAQLPTGWPRASRGQAPAPAAVAEPVAWLHDDPQRYDVIHAEVKDLLVKSRDAAGYLHRPLDKSAHYTIPLYTAPHPAAQEDAVDTERYRWLAAHCRSTAEHWGGRWSIVVDGPAPKSHDSKDDFDAAIDAAIDRARAAKGGDQHG